MIAERKVSLPNKLGLHARPAMQLVELANKFSSVICITKNGQKVDCKNMLAVLTLAAPQGTMLLVSADGDDAEDAIESVCGLIEVGFGED
ncbi:MAG TPA: HPr family phosphocarrier protein [Planctomycetota bacterium]|nr:HPr family phosphocarrier protein [Planctomycetota bacterium]HUW31216.1 HPr family phosphocarrier protein [Planctomycetota bacterium]